MSNYTSLENFNTNISFNIENKKEEEKEKNYFDKNEWGPKMWDIMHIFSYNYDVNPDETTKKNAFNFFNSICLLLPCDYCKNHCYQLIQNNPPEVDDKDKLVNWVLFFHNSVNRRLHKRTWTRTELDKKYDTGNAFCH